MLLAAACGSTDDGESSSPIELGPVDSRLEVTALDIDFEPNELEAEPGTIAVVLENEGSIRHTLVIDGVDGFKLEVDTRGDSDAGTVELEPATYNVYCDVAGHRASGMVAMLTVR